MEELTALAAPLLARVHTTPAQWWRKMRRLAAATRSNSKLRGHPPPDVDHLSLARRYIDQHGMCHHLPWKRLTFDDRCGRLTLASTERLCTRTSYTHDNTRLACLGVNTPSQWSAEVVDELLLHVQRPVPPAVDMDDVAQRIVERRTREHQFVSGLLGSSRAHDKHRRERLHARIVRTPSVVEIDHDWFARQWRRQRGRCHVSGMPLVLARDSPWSASIERLEHALTYTRSNCVLIGLVFQATHGAQWTPERFNELFDVAPGANIYNDCG